ncbi:MAG TPA: Lrp/AsnC family transcriptional regulator [Thermomicrobiales bacterium]|nr:Lrp/AsnC family transcriptional regulator [Thermomicrobiales bacterium]
MSTIDTLDDRILAELQSNGRLTMKALAERVGLSSPAMIERVRRLEERGVLAGYRAVVDPHALGRSLTALISVELDRRHYDAFLNRLRSEPAVEECHRVTGDRSFVVKAHVSSTEELELLVDELQDVGAKCSTNIVLSTPILGAPIVPPEGTISQRTRLTRRRRRPAAATTRAEENGVKPENSTPRRRGRRKATEDEAETEE